MKRGLTRESSLKIVIRKNKMPFELLSRVDNMSTVSPIEIHISIQSELAVRHSGK